MTLASNNKNSLAGFGSAKGSNEEAYLFQKLIRTGFKTNNVDDFISCNMYVWVAARNLEEEERKCHFEKSWNAFILKVWIRV